ncbi:hypothetical protein EVAR_7383_1 [Eumeta japonica]|uniref:Uncharacterized protein n=1 Tax=Eumeta variegata TaxID=151549 RepID=A0A4C1V7P5_EUMVA|nr:hypothetical protein EVAR_7383_1 [Eumeta japonica]
MRSVLLSVKFETYSTNLNAFFTAFLQKSFRISKIVLALIGGYARKAADGSLVKYNLSTKTGQRTILACKSAIPTGPPRPSRPTVAPPGGHSAKLPAAPLK